MLARAITAAVLAAATTSAAPPGAGVLARWPHETPAYRRTFRHLLERPELADRYDRLILACAARDRLDPRLLKAIIAAESEFVAGATSPKGAVGLMQLTPPTAAEFGADPRRLADPEVNVGAGAAYLRLLFRLAWRRYGLDPRLSYYHAPPWVVQRVLAGYNGGPRLVGQGHPSKSTRAYVRKVALYLRSPVSRLRYRRAPAS